MKKILWLTSLLMLLAIAAEPIKLFHLTIINKAEMPIAIRLIGTSDEDHLFYLSIPEGNRADPVTQIFNIPGDLYQMQLYYIETYDPVYGFHCRQPVPNLLLATRNIKVVVLPCDVIPGNVGEPSMRKYLPYPVFSDYFLHRYWIFRFIF